MIFPSFSDERRYKYRSITDTGWYHCMYRIMVAISYSAIKNGYPITSSEISRLCIEFDKTTGNWYENRPIEKESDRALEYVYRTAHF